jgi:hypothetical protein
MSGIAGVLHKEQGEWHVVSIPDQAAARVTQFLFGSADAATMSQESTDFGRSAPPPEASSIAEANEVARRYLRFWEEGRTGSMLQLTARVSGLYAHTLADHKAKLSQRPDEGVCPSTDVQSLKLEPVNGLSVLDQQRLIGLCTENPGNNRRERFVDLDTRGDTPNPDATRFARRGDTMIFRYVADGENYLMLLVRFDGNWAVLEPAMRL